METTSPPTWTALHKSFVEMYQNIYGQRPILIDDGARMVRFYPDKVMYVKADGNYTDVFTDNNVRSKPIYKLSYKIGKLYEKFHAYGFVRINRSELVNCVYVNQISGFDIFMQDGRKLRISEKMRDEVVSHFDVLVMKRE